MDEENKGLGAILDQIANLETTDNFEEERGDVEQGNHDRPWNNFQREEDNDMINEVQPRDNDQSDGGFEQEAEIERHANAEEEVEVEEEKEEEEEESTWNENVPITNISDEGYDDWHVPANYDQLGLNSDMNQQPVWQCIKRPWIPTEEQLTPSQKSARKKKEEAKRVAQEIRRNSPQIDNNADTDLGDISDGEDEEPGDGDDKFHYYWHLSTPEPYKRASSVGMHWRAVWYVPNDTTKANKGQLEPVVGWLNEARWKRFCQDTNTSSDSVAIFDIKDNRMTQVASISSIDWAGKKLKGSDKRTSFIKHVNETFAADPVLQTNSQILMTEESLIESELNISSNKLPFQFKDGTFAVSKDKLEKEPSQKNPSDDPKAANSEKDPRNPEGVYVKLRRKHIKLLQVSGGLFDPAQKDVFIRKTEFDRLANIGTDRDPTPEMIENRDWKSDPRKQLLPKELRKLGAKTTPHKTVELPGNDEKEKNQRVNRRQDEFVWARNGKGFSFRFYHNKMEQEAWNKYRRECIGSLEEDRGWTRYIDPPIPLYIVPCSNDHDAVEFIKECIIQAMSDLDMPANCFQRGSDIDKVDKRTLARLKRGSNVKPDCATNTVHLIRGAEAESSGLVKLALSPFGHYETWIRKADCTSYNDSRKGRQLPSPKTHSKQIDAARDLLKAGGSVVPYSGGSNDVRDIDLKKGRGNPKQPKGKHNATPSGPNRKLHKETATKIRQAKGTRSGAKSQAVVMGSSATPLAHALGWTDFKTKTAQTTTDPKWPGTSHMPAEWLHRCAYSWGGITEEGRDSSQKKCNLIFGTGECNSVMTRYEKAWQSLVCREDDRLKRTRNSPDTMCLSANINREAFPPGLAFGEELGPGGLDSEADQPLTGDEQLEQLPHWLCYALDYRLTRSSGFEPLGNQQEFKTVFYPWQRGFFTKFEQKLDEVVLEHAYETWENNNQDIKDNNLMDEVKIQEGYNKRNFEQAAKGRAESSPIDDSRHRDDPFTNHSNHRDLGDIHKSEARGSKALKTDSKKDDHWGGSLTHDMTIHAETPIPIHSSNNMFSRNQMHSLAVMPMMTPQNAGIWSSRASRTPETSTLMESNVEDGMKKGYDIADSANIGNPAYRKEKVIKSIVEKPLAVEPNKNKLQLNSPTSQMASIWDNAGTSRTVVIDGLTLPNASVVAGPNTSLGDISSASIVHNSPETKFDQEKVAPGAISERRPTSHQEVDPTSRAQQQYGASDPVQDYASSPRSTVPKMFVVRTENFRLFGKHKVRMETLQNTKQSRAQQYRMILPNKLCLGDFIPSLAGSDLDAIMLNDTSVTYRSHGRLAGLTFSTTITLSGMLQPVNTLLESVLHQEVPCIDITAFINSSLPPHECLTRVPEPLGFTMRGELPKINAKVLFDVLTITHIGVDVTGRRLGSAGGYELGYALFGRGHLDAATQVQWRINKFGKQWNISISTNSDSWRNVAGINGVDLKDVFMEATWLGTNLSTVRLGLRATFSIKEQATLMLQGKFGKNDFEVAGYLTDCSLTTLKQLYNQVFGGDIDVTTEHKIVLDSLVLILSKSNGVSLYGQVSVDGHLAAEASIFIGGGSIDFEGQITSRFSVIDQVEIEDPALALSIHTSKSSVGSGFKVQFCGTVYVLEKHRFDVLIYVNKTPEKGLEYTLYGSYDGGFYLHDLMDDLKDSNLLGNVGMRKLAICASNMENPGALIKTPTPGYKIKRGLTIYAEVDLPAINDLFTIEKGTSLVVSALYQPANGPGDRSKFEISIQIPNEEAFKIDRFSVGELSLSVSVDGSEPSIKIGGSLSFPIEDDKKLKLALGLSAGVYEATGQAQLSGSWVNPFQLSKAITINNLKAGLGISYASGAPSSITIGGAVIIGKVEGTVLIHTGVDPTKQLLHVKIVNLDVAQLLRTIGNLIEVDLKVPAGKNTFFIRKLDLYLSTGIELFDVEYPRGIRLEVDMMLFGKHAKMDAQVSTGLVKLKGSVEKFKIGDLVVSAATSENKDPTIDMELSPKSQRIRIDGKVIFQENNWVIIMVDIDTAKGSFNLFLDIVIGDSLKIHISATLENGLPEATQDRIEEIEDKGSKNSAPEKASKEDRSASEALVQTGQNLLKDKVGALTNGGQLQGKIFKIHAEVDQKIIDHLVSVANGLLNGERDSAELGRLQSSLTAAATALKASKDKYDSASLESQSAINRAVGLLDKRTTELKQSIAAERTRKAEVMSQLDLYERNIILQIAQDGRDQMEMDKHEASLAEDKARNAHAIVEEWRTRMYALDATNNAVRVAIEEQNDMQAKLAAAQVAATRHLQDYPDPHSPEYAAWKWKNDELAAQVEANNVKVKTAVDNVKLAQLAFEELNMGSIDEAQGKLKELSEYMDAADAEARERRTAVEVNIEARALKATEKRFHLEKRRAAFILHADGEIEKLVRKEAVFQKERSERVEAARAIHDVSKTEASVTYNDCLEKHRAANIKLQAYQQLKYLISQANKDVLTALRFAVNVIDQASRSLLSIQSFTLDGSFGGSSSQVGARVKCKIGGYTYDFNFLVDISNIVSFFIELWNKITGVIASVAKALLDIARKGVDAIKTFCAESAQEIKIAYAVTTEVFMKELAAHEQEVQNYLDSVDLGPLQPYRAVIRRELQEQKDKAQAEIDRKIREEAHRAARKFQENLEEEKRRLEEALRRGQLKPLSFGEKIDMVGRLGRGLFGSASLPVMGMSDTVEKDVKIEEDASKVQLIERRTVTTNTTGVKTTPPTVEDVKKADESLQRSKNAIQALKVQLERVKDMEAMSQDDARSVRAEFEKMVRQIEIMENQGSIQRALLKLDVMIKEGAQAEVIGALKTSIVQLEGQTSSIRTDLEVQDIVREINRRRTEIEQMVKMELEQGEIQVAVVRLKDLMFKKRLVERREQIEQEIVKCKLLQLSGVGEKELEGSISAVQAMKQEMMKEIEMYES